MKDSNMPATELSIFDSVEMEYQVKGKKMKKSYFLIPFLFLLSTVLISCYTQLQAPKPITESNPNYYSEEEFYLPDTVMGDEGIVVHHYYHYSDPYYYDPWYYDPWYGSYSTRWGFYVGFSNYWWDPFWYPWGGWGPCCYPVISPYYGWYNPYYYYWYPYYPPGYDHHYANYQKRSWDRRTNEPIRQIARGTSRTDKQLAGNTRRSASENQTPIYVSGTRSSASSSSRIVHRDNGSSKTATASSTAGSQKVSGQRSVKRQESSINSRSGKGTSTQGRSSKRSQSGSYSPKSKSGNSSGSAKSSGSSGTSVRSSNRGSSSSSGSSSSGRSSSSGSSNSGSSGSSTRSTTRK
ncbi:MAG: hypothetical protein HGA23_01960 [Bacteroidales bacterium]|nr:hypothetical protein [Bacteroidales bacterium]